MTPDSPPGQPAPAPNTPPPGGRLWPFLLLIAAAAVWVDFASIHARHRDDSIIFSLASLYAWTPFFWEQDRVGLLVPLICSVVRDPWANLLAQVGLTTFLGLSVPLLAAEYVRPGSAARWAGVAAAAAALALAPPLVLNNLLFECYYPTALFLGLAGLIVLDRGGPRPGWGRSAAALGCFALAHWVYVAVPLGLVGLVIGRCWLAKPWRDGQHRLLPRLALDPHSRAALLLLFAGFAFGVALMTVGSPDSPNYVPTNRQGLDPSRWAKSWVEYAGRVFGRDGGGPWLATLIGVAAAGLVGSAFGRPAASRAAIVLLLAGATEYFLIGTRDWPAKNQYHPRYILAALSFIGPAAALPATAALFDSSRRWVRRVAGVGLVIALLGAAGWQFGLPSSANARAGLDESIGQHNDEFLATGANAVGGEYWRVWATVFHANAVLRERGDDRVVVGVAYRSSVWRPVWEAKYPDGMLVAVFRGEKDRTRFLEIALQFGLSEPRLIGSTKTFDLYTTRPAGRGQSD